MTDRTRIILEDLEAVRENLLAARPRPRQTHAQNAFRDAERELIL